MKRFFTIVALLAFVLAAPGPALARQSGNLSIYWIDVEGGAATLFVSPSGESMLFDTGFPDGDRDAKRIYAAAQKAGLRQIDHVDTGSPRYLAGASIDVG